MSLSLEMTLTPKKCLGCHLLQENRCILLHIANYGQNLKASLGRDAEF